MDRRIALTFLSLVLILFLSVASRSDKPAFAVGKTFSQMPVRGIVRAVKKAEISTDLSVRAKAIYVRVADSFKKGAVLVEFDCAQLEANRDALAAANEAAKVSLESQQRLFKRGAGGRQDLRLAEIETKKSAAEMRALTARIKHCAVNAPFDGRVVELSLQEYETPPSGKAFMSLVGVGAYEIDLIVPSRWLKKIAVGSKLDLTIDETGTAHAARVDRTGAAVDPVSQTIQIIAAFDDENEQVLPGMSGTASFDFMREAQ